jgi:(p)ppGpp synthase/HD superfamily hydrolase
MFLFTKVESLLIPVESHQTSNPSEMKITQHNRASKPRTAPSTLDKAIALAVRGHAGQKDKAGVDYILHPLRVMLAMKDKVDRIVAVLHDVVEDCGVTLDDIESDFGKTVADAVDAISHREAESYPDYWRRVAENPIAMRVKVADSTDNLARTDLLKEPERSQMTRKYRDTLEALSISSILPGVDKGSSV